MKIEKTKIHIPTESFGFIEEELTGTPQEIVKEYLRIRDAWKTEQAKFPKTLDEKIRSGEITTKEEVIEESKKNLPF